LEDFQPESNPNGNDETREDLDETSHKGYQIYKIELLINKNLRSFSREGCKDLAYEKEEGKKR